MIDERAAAEGGFTMVEVVVAVAVIAAVVLAGIGVALGSRSFAVAAAASEFDHMLETARTVARQTQGVTLAFAPDAYGDGTEVRILAAAPDGTLTPTSTPVFHTRAVIEETESLGKAPFAFVVHASGSLGGRPGFRRSATPIPPEVGCPARGSFPISRSTPPARLRIATFRAASSSPPPAR